ncbi:MAG: TonB family protein [Bacteroidetes bacterium]|nr:TonB family protein [Bacteroidota bacterium]
MNKLLKPLSLFATIIIVCAFSINVNAQDDKKEILEILDEFGGGKVDTSKVFTFVENEAEFPGGIDALGQFLASNIKYPQEAKEKKITGKIFLTFVIEKDGSINDIKILRDIGYGCGEEAKRVVKLMPKWKPANQKGKNLRQQFLLPVNFNLSTDEE